MQSQPRVVSQRAPARDERGLCFEHGGTHGTGVYLGRSALEAPEVDPVVFVHNMEGCAPLVVGQLRLCRITGASISDLVAHPVDSVML